MTDYIYIFTALAPAANVDEINTLAEALGHGPDTLSVPLSSDGSEPATHYGTATHVTQDFVDTLGTGLAGEVPPELEGQYTGAEIEAILGNFTYSVVPAQGNTAGGRFETLLSENSLVRVESQPL